ncbi:ABC transporter F family member 4-like [Clupea harengus]|uniref:ABC transporter F family member 4-like n=1 Tax=Clupea harengus TaxID=7950 RepID=A0A8M1KN75_CLUHA|nr:ABC transporter F family member 4-like [Clupea harengus]
MCACVCVCVCACGETPRCRVVWTGPAMRGGKIVEGQRVPEAGHSQPRLPPALHLYIPSSNEPDDGQEQTAEGGEVTEPRCPEGEAETNGVPDIAVSQSQHERDDKSDEDDTATETPKDISKTTEAHDNSGCTPKEDNGMTDTTNYPGNLDGEEGIGSDQLEETKYVKDDRECNTSGDMVFAWQKQDAEDENHQGPNTRLPGGFGSPETQRTTEESEQKSTNAPADCTLEASFDEEERNGNANNQQRGAGHEDERLPETFERSPEVERSREDEQSQEEELMLTSEKCDGEARLNEDNRQWERWMAKPQKGVEGNDGIRGTDDNQNVSNKTRYTWGHKRRMRERGKTTEARSRGFSTSNQLQKGPQNTIEGARPTERTRLPTSFLVCPEGEAETNGVPDIAVSQSQHERDDKSDEDDTATETPKDISKTTEAHDNSGCTPKEDNGMTDTTNYPGNLDGEEGIGSDQLEETKYVKDDRECNTSGDMVFAWQKQDAEDENHQGPNTRLPGGFGSPETQRTTEESEQKSTDAPADCTLEASFDEEERNGNANNQQRGAGHEDERLPETFERSPEVERSREDEQSQEEELMLTSEKCDGEARLNEDNRQWERWMAKPQKGVEGNDGIRGTDSNNVSNKTRDKQTRVNVFPAFVLHHLVGLSGKSLWSQTSSLAPNEPPSSHQNRSVVDHQRYPTGYNKQFGYIQTPVFTEGRGTGWAPAGCEGHWGRPSFQNKNH